VVVGADLHMAVGADEGGQPIDSRSGESFACLAGVGIVPDECRFLRDG